jgi:hypothetical protein
MRGSETLKISLVYLNDVGSTEEHGGYEQYGPSLICTHCPLTECTKEQK